MSRDAQLTLFEPPEPAAAADPLEATYREARALAERLPGTVYFGTSSWSFPGWRGIVYRSAASAGTLARDGLREYARHPLLRTVGIDRSYYAPVPEDDLRRYADQLPDGFRCCAKAPAAVTSDDPALFSAGRFLAETVEPFGRAFAAHTGPFILQFAPGVMRAVGSPDAFAERLDAFLSELPRDFEYAVELRDRRLFTAAYKRVLSRHEVTHVFNGWSAVPSPDRQAAWLPPEDLPFAVVRLLMRQGAEYESERERFRPFDRIVEPDEPVRDAVAAIVRRATANARRVYVLVNNKAEGSAPLTIRAIAERIAGVRT